MKRILRIALLFFFLALPLPLASAETPTVRITSTLHQNFTGEFINDELAQELTPSGKLGQLVFVPRNNSKLWVIDAALIDEVTAMTGGYKLATAAIPIGKEIAISWLTQLKKVTASNDVVALAYGNPGESMAKHLAPSELKIYYAFGKTSLEMALGRTVRSEPNGGWSRGTSNLSPSLRNTYSEARRDLTHLSRVVSSPELVQLRMRLARLLSPALDAGSRVDFSFNARTAVDSQLHKLRVNPGKYQLTTEKTVLPMTVINDFPVEVTVNIKMLAMNSRITVDSFTGVKLAAHSKSQLGFNAFVIAPGQTIVFAQMTDATDNDVVPPAVLALNATVIDSRLIWFTTGAAILLLLAAITQSMRRVRKGRHHEI